MRILAFILLITLLATSCEKIVAEDITDETPVLILPAVNDTIANNPAHFKWGEMEGASKYRLEIVSPSFTSISQFLLDSSVVGTDFYFDLDSNEYELRLTAQNGGYESQILGPIKFWVGVQSAGTSTNVVVNSPINDSYVNASFNNQFTWTSLAAATNYEFALREGASFSTGTIIDGQNNISTTSYTTSFVLSEGEYFWGVKAYFGTTETPFTTAHFYVDEFDPNVAVLSSPGNLSFDFAGNVVFSWGNGTDSGTIQSPVISKLEIATDAGFGTIIETVNVNGNSGTVNLVSGTYFWRVTNTDEAGNTAGASTVYQVTLS